LTAIILSIPPTVLEKRLKEYKKDIDRLKKRVFEIDKRNKDKNYEIIKIIKNSRYDALTKAMNKDFFNEIVGSKIVESKLYKHPLSIIMFDIDFFKKINDTYGHLVGDKVLSEVGNVVKKNTRKSEIFARVGGEEFAILLSDTSLDGAILVAEKLRVAIQNNRFAPVKEVTCSFGVTLLKDNDTIESFVKRADTALYKAKQNGRNRVEVLV